MAKKTKQEKITKKQVEDDEDDLDEDEDEEEVEETEVEETEEDEDEDEEGEDEDESEDEEESEDEDEEEEEEEEAPKASKKGKKGEPSKKQKGAGLVPRTPVAVSKEVFAKQPKEIKVLLKKRDELIANGDKKGLRKLRAALRAKGFRLQSLVQG